jgi:hypothetical protein
MNITKGKFGLSTNEKSALWVPIYQEYLNILDPTKGVIIPLGDRKYESAGQTSVNTIGAISATFTYSTALPSFTRVYDFLGPYQIPIIHFDGITESADSPDADYWSRVSGAFSIGAWINGNNFVSVDGILTKHDSSSNGEWYLATSGGDAILFLRDQSVPASASRRSTTNLSTGTWYSVIATFDGATGASAGNTINIYLNGAVNQAAGITDGTYVDMENKTNIVSIGKFSNSSLPHDGLMTGGPLGPFFTQKELSPIEVNILYESGRALLGL